MVTNLELAHFWQSNEPAKDPLENKKLNLDGACSDDQCYNPENPVTENICKLKVIIAEEIKRRGGSADEWATLMNDFFSPFWFHNYEKKDRRRRKERCPIEAAVISLKK